MSARDLAVEREEDIVSLCPPTQAERWALARDA